MKKSKFGEEQIAFGPGGGPEGAQCPQRYADTES